MCSFHEPIIVCSFHEPIIVCSFHEPIIVCSFHERVLVCLSVFPCARHVFVSPSREPVLVSSSS